MYQLAQDSVCVSGRELTEVEQQRLLQILIISLRIICRMNPFNFVQAMNCYPVFVRCLCMLDFHLYCCTFICIVVVFSYVFVL